MHTIYEILYTKPINDAIGDGGIYGDSYYPSRRCHQGKVDVRSGMAKT